MLEAGEKASVLVRIDPLEGYTNLGEGSAEFTSDGTFRVAEAAREQAMALVTDIPPDASHEIHYMVGGKIYDMNGNKLSA